MITFDRVSFTYNEAASPTLHQVSLDIPEGELCVVVGETGTGKSTLLRAINGLVPHFSGGTLAGTITVDGRTTRENRPRDLADVVGFVGQNPLASFVTETVEDELAYTMENLGVPADAMRRRVEDAVDLLGLQDLRDRSLRALSGGQQQRVAIGAVLTASPRLLVLDEPTSALDPAAAEEVLSALARLVHDLGLTVVMAEHRLERVVPFADRIILVPGGGAPLVIGSPESVMQASTVAPPLVELGRLLGWEPLPLSVRDARRKAGSLARAARSAVAVATGRFRDACSGRRSCLGPKAHGLVRTGRGTRRRGPLGPVRRSPRADGEKRLGEVDPAQHAGRCPASVPGVGDRGRAGSAVASVGLISSVTWDWCPRTRGSFSTERASTPNARQRTRCRRCPEGRRCAHWRACCPAFLPIGTRAICPRASAWLSRSPSWWLRRPISSSWTSRREGWTIPARTASSESCANWPKKATPLSWPRTTLSSPRGVADRAVVLADGQIITDGPARQVVCHSPIFAPQVAKVLAPEEWLTVDEVRSALDEPVPA